jgi:hypothetical protein
MKNACCAFTILLGLVVGLGAHWSQSPATRPQPVWYWYSDCRESKPLGLEIFADGKSIYRSSLRICRMPSEDVPPLKEAPRLAFLFRGGHAFRTEHRTNPKEIIDANIWQAGGEADGLLMGISFSTKSRVLLNTVHLAKADHASESQLDRGLVMRTYPVPQLP